MKFYTLKYDKANIYNELKKIGCEPASLPIFDKKFEILPIKLHDLTPAFANIVKQEMLSSKGDAAVHARAITGKIEKSDAILLGSISMYREFIAKLRRQNYKTLREICDDLETLLKNYKRDIGPINFKNGKKLNFSRSVIMGILNLTADSFYDGGKYQNLDVALEHAQSMIRNGADIIDIGGESTRPGSEPVDAQEEMKRVIPVIEMLSAETKVVLSVDTYKADVAKEALNAGADFINDISGMTFDKKMPKVIAEAGCPVVIMHIQGTPRDMQKNPYYEDIIADLVNYFDVRIQFAIENGIIRDNIIIDPGIGFGKRYEDNIRIIRQMDSLKKYGLPIMIGASRKSFIGKILDKNDPGQRLFATMGVHALAKINGAHIFRVHDVQEHYEMLKSIDEINIFPVNNILE